MMPDTWASRGREILPACPWSNFAAASSFARLSRSRKVSEGPTSSPNRSEVRANSFSI